MSGVFFDCFTFMQQEFLVCVTVHKARNLCLFNADTYVKITLDKKSKSTKVSHGSENPYFNEYFVFERVCSLNELLRLTILFQVFRHSYCRRDSNLGELFVDLTTIWNQPGHMFFKKWGKLDCPLDQLDCKSRGYLQVDLSIVSKHETPAPAVFEAIDYDNIEQNLLQPDYESSDVNNVRHYITIFKGMFLKKADYIVQVSFAGFHSKTKVAKSCTHPEWNEQFSFSWVFPSLCRTFLIQVLVNELLQWKCISDFEVHFDEITFPENFPSFGPSFLHIYDALQTNNYIGRLLVSIRTEKLQKHLSPVRCIVTKKVPTFAESSYWAVENFVIAGLIWTGDFIQADSSNLKFGFRCGEWCSNSVEVFLQSYTDSPGRRYFKEESPQRMIRLSGFFPDCRLKYDVDQVLKDLFKLMKTQIRNYRLFEIKYSMNKAIHAKCLRAIISSFKEKVLRDKINIQYAGGKQLTDWDKQRIDHIAEYLENLVVSFEHFRKILKSSRKNYLANVRTVCRELSAVMKDVESLVSHRLQDLWPDLILQVSSGGTVIGTCRLNPIDFMFCTRTNCAGRLCGQRHNIVFKSSSCMHTCRDCGCIAGKIDGWIWIGTETEYQEYCHPSGWNLKEPMFYAPSEETMFSCRIYIHQAKIRPGDQKKTGECSAQARVTLLDYSVETKSVQQSLSPIWNQVITIENIVLPGPCQSYSENPILVVIELFCHDEKGRPDYLGCGILCLSTNSSGNAEQVQSAHASSKRICNMIKKKAVLQKLKLLTSMSPPLLKWTAITFHGLVKAEVLISGEICEMKSKVQGDEIKITTSLPAEIRPVTRQYKVEVVFAGFRNLQKSFHKCPPGKYRLKLNFADLSLTSGPSAQKSGESINFVDLYASGLVHLPEQQEYWPPIILTHIEHVKDKEKYTIGAAMLSTPHKYLMSSVAVFTGNKTVTFEDEDDEKSESSRYTYLEMETSFYSDSHAETTPLLTKPQTKKILKPSKSSEPRWNLLAMLLSAFSKHKPVAVEELHQKEEEEFSWWTKFYNSVDHGDDTACIDSRKHRLVIFGSELENQIEFNFLQDWAEPVPLVRGIQHKRNTPPKEEVYCTAKCHIEIRKCKSMSPRSGQNEKLLKNAHNARYQEISSLVNPVEVLVRVYIVQGIRLRAKDMYSDSDPYVKLQLGDKVISDRANYIPDQANPVFGKMFQLECVIPRAYILHISVYDRDFIDDLIGCTSIDLEDRFRSKHRAYGGIANEYSQTGYNIWRDLRSPMDILKEIALRHDLDPPKIIEKQMIFAGRTFDDSTQISKDESIENRLSVSVLNRLNEIPQIGYKLVPEHVETRSLYLANRPGIEQGKLQLWVEIYEKDNVPPPIDITPIPPKKYELRVIIFNTSAVVFDETNIFGEQMSDIYLKGWIGDINQAQYTDVHYRSLNGEGNFNWRMIFSLAYSRVEDMIVLTTKAAIYEQFDTELKVPPMLYIQIWDNDVFSPDDFLGVVNVNLSHFEEPFATAKKCSLKNRNRFVNLFNTSVVKGWFPARGKLADGTVGLTGKVEMMLQLLTEQEAAFRPVGLGRDPPEPLPVPKRPETSFNWFTNPFLSFKHILMPLIKKCLCYICIIVVIVMFIMALVYTLPGELLKKFVGLSH